MTKKTSSVGKGIPESLADLLKKIRTDIFDYDKTTMAEQLNAVARDPKLTPRIARGDEVRRIEDRERNLLFENIECYSRLLGIPTAALSFVSRYQRTDLDEAQVVATELLALVTDAKRQGRERLNVNDLHHLAARIDLQYANRPPLPSPQYDEDELSAIETAKARAQRLGHTGVDDLGLFRAQSDDD